MNPEVTFSIILEERTPKKDGTFPIKVRLSYRRNQRYYSTKYNSTKVDFAKMMNGTPKGDLKTKKMLLNAIESKVLNILESMNEFSFHEFKKIYDGKKEDVKDVFSLMKKYADNLREFGQIKTAKNYESALNSFKLYHKRKSLLLNEVTIEFLRRYEKHMLSNSKSTTTIGMYLRTLRTILNIALSKGLITQADYPFGRHKYQVQSGRKLKRAFPISHIQKIFEYKAKSAAEEKARNYWILSYLCNGMNMKDIARLRNKNISNDMIHFIRAKTEYTSRFNLKPVSVYMTDEIKKIISILRNEATDQDAYLFPILSESMTPELETNKIELFIKTTNKYLKRIGKELSLEIKLTTYTARHSFATILKRNNVPVSYISDSMGHSNQKTSEDYFGSFEDTDKKEYADVLTKFNAAI